MVDPELALSCPSDITAACGMDAFTQLLESFVSVKESPLTDTLAWSGMERMKDALVPAAGEGSHSLEIRADMAYGALISGITLANAGLGVIHGLASAIGGRHPIPHGVVCGVLLEPATRITILRLRENEQKGDPSLGKYARVGHLLAGGRPDDIEQGCDLLLERLDSWNNALKLPGLNDYGINSGDIPAIAAIAGNGNNPGKLNPDDIAMILKTVIH